MPVYLVAYDLINEKSSHDYEPLWDHLERLGGQRTQYSLWLVDVGDTPQELATHFKQYLDKDDRVWVTRVRKGQYGYVNAIKGTTDWLKNNPPD